MFFPSPISLFVNKIKRTFIQPRKLFFWQYPDDFTLPIHQCNDSLSSTWRVLLFHPISPKTSNIFCTVLQDFRQNSRKFRLVANLGFLCLPCGNSKASTHQLQVNIDHCSTYSYQTLSMVISYHLLSQRYRAITCYFNSLQIFLKLLVYFLKIKTHILFFF